MSRSLALSSLVMLTCIIGSLCDSPAFARGGRGGGGGMRGGGGGGFSGGGFQGAAGQGGGARAGGQFQGGARPAPTTNRSPSMSHLPSSRPAQSPRPAASAGRGGRAGELSTGQRTPGAPRPAGEAGGRSQMRAGESFQRPSNSELSSFLNLPSNTPGNNAPGSASPRTFSSGGQPPTASQLPSGGNSRSFETAGGGTITVGGRGGSAQGEGGTVGGGIGGIHIETAGGQEFARVRGGVGATDGTNAAIRGGSATAGQGARGSFANVSRGYADTAGNRAAGSATVAQNRAGYTAANVRGGTAQGGVAQIGSVSAIRGPGGNVVSTGRGAAFVNGQFVGGQAWGAVNGAYTHWNCFTPNWIGHYPNAWWPGKWAVATTAWAAATWPYASAYCGCTGEPTYYDYGSNVTYEDGNVYMGDQPVATAQEYYDQADQIAQAGSSADSSSDNPANNANTESTAENADDNEEWIPLGVFAVIAEEDQTHTDKVLQLALNREGVIRGNFQDLLTDKLTPVSGAVDKSSQRVSLKLEGNDSVIVETGLYNLTNDEVPILVHIGPDRQEGRVLIRLQQPADERTSDAQGAP